MHDILQSPADPEGRGLPLTLSLSQLHINAGGGGKTTATTTLLECNVIYLFDPFFVRDDTVALHKSFF